MESPGPKQIEQEITPIKRFIKVQIFWADTLLLCKNWQ